MSTKLRAPHTFSFTVEQEERFEKCKEHDIKLIDIVLKGLETFEELIKKGKIK